MKPFPEDVARFVYEHVETIDQLEILRILGEDREREWDSTTLAADVQTRPQAVRAHLTAMHARGLVMMTTRGASLVCRYGVSTPEMEKMVVRLLQTYKERPVTMIKMIYERAKDPLRDFPDAFRTKKND